MARSKWSSIGGILAILTTGALLCAAAPAQAGVPADPAARGVITLCGPTGKPVTSGTLQTAPFVWKAVSSQAAPSGYSGAGENANLLIYQVRPGVAPYDWSGDVLTGDARYWDDAHPVAQATRADISLGDFTQGFPPMGDGYYELRMHFGKLFYGITSNPYPAAMIQVTGSTWHLVRGGGGSCAPTGKSSEVYAGAAPAAPAPKYAAEVAAAERTSAQSTASTVAGKSGTSSPSAGSTDTPGGKTATTPSTTTSASKATNGGGHATSIGIGVGAAAAVLLVGGGIGYAVRRRAT